MAQSIRTMSSGSRKGSGWLHVMIAALAVLTLGLVFLGPFLGKVRRQSPPASEVQTVIAQVDEGSRAAIGELVKTAAEAAQACVSGHWDIIVDRARRAAAAGPDQLRIFTWTLFTAFDALETADQRGALLAFFESGRDIRLSESFTVSKGGWLADWPTLRVALFDYVAQRDPVLASELAVSLLQLRPDEPGEWALALRELARGRTADQWSSLAVVRLREFIRDQGWAEKGAPGWVEGFDIVVAGRSPQFLPDLAMAGRPGASRASRFAAFLAADRLTLAAPLACFKALNEDHTLFAEATGTRAGMFGRADVTDLEQLAELKRYFEREDVGAGERAQFAAVFPYQTVAPTHRLLTAALVRATEDAAAIDAAASSELDSWIQSEAFPGWMATFQEIRKRLAARNGSAAKAAS